MTSTNNKWIALILTTMIFFVSSLYSEQLHAGMRRGKASQLTGYCTLLYWPNKNYGFGHVALEVFCPGNTSSEGDIYLSWATNNEKLNDMNYHCRDPKIVRFDSISLSNITRLQIWLMEQGYMNADPETYGHDYRLFTKNCAHATLEGLRVLKLPIRQKPYRWGLRPHKVYKIAKALRDAEDSNSQNNAKSQKNANVNRH